MLGEINLGKVSTEENDISPLREKQLPSKIKSKACPESPRNAPKKFLIGLYLLTWLI
jgi:hypothetical protein